MSHKLSHKFKQDKFNSVVCRFCNKSEAVHWVTPIMTKKRWYRLDWIVRFLWQEAHFSPSRRFTTGDLQTIYSPIAYMGRVTVDSWQRDLKFLWSHGAIKRGWRFKSDAFAAGYEWWYAD